MIRKLLAGIFSLVLAAGAAFAETVYYEYTYVESTGSQTIGTGVCGSSTLEAALDCIFQNETGNWYLGFKKNDNADWRVFQSSGTFFFDSGSGRAKSSGLSRTRSLIHLKTEETSFYAAVTNVETGAQTLYCSDTMASGPESREVEVFARASLRVYGLKMWDFANPGDAERTLLRNFVPVVQDTDGVTTNGLYDLVGKTFYPDANGNAFTLGTATGRIILSDGTYVLPVRVTGPSGSTFTVNGVAYTASCSTLLPLDSTVTVSVQAEEGEEVVWVSTGIGTPSGTNLVAKLTEAFESLYFTTKKRDFGSKVSNWTGKGSNTDFTNAANWDNGVPDLGTKAVVAPESALALTLADGTLVGGLVAGTNGVAVNFTVGGGVRILNDFTYGAGMMTFNTAREMFVGGDLVLSNGVTLTHTINTAANDQLYKVNLHVIGAATVAAGAAISTEGRGYPFRTGPGYVKDSRGCHAGGISEAYVYGSISAPTNCGSGGYDDYKGGGGVVRLVVDGTLTLDGTIQSDAQAVSAGGSVWITCAALAGAGTVSASGGETGWRGAGGGGRVAIWYTGDDPEAGWTGTVKAAGGRSKAAQSGAAGTVYYQYKDGDIRNSKVVIGFEPPNVYDTLQGQEMFDIGTTFLSAATGAGVLGTVIITNRAYVTVPDGETLKVHGDWYCNPATHANSYRGGAVYPNAALMTTTVHTVEFCGTNDAALAGFTTFQRFVCDAPGKTLRFGIAADSAPKTVMSVLKHFEVVGAKGDGNLVCLSPSETVTDWSWHFTLDGEASTKVSYARIAASKATVDGKGYTWLIPAYDSQDGNGNSGWDFDPDPLPGPGATLTWRGGAGTGWINGRNWLPSREPDPQDHLVVPGRDAYGDPLPSNPVLDVNVPAQTVNDLLVTNAANLVVNGTPMSVTNALDIVEASLAVKGAAAFSAKDVTVGTNGVLVVDTNTVTVTGTLRVRAGGTLVVTNAGALAAENLVVEKGAVAHFDSGTVTCGTDLAFAAGARVAVGTAEIVLKGAATFGAADLFDAGDGTVTVAGTGARTNAIDFADAALNVLAVRADCAAAAFADGFSANRFVAKPTAAQTLVFAAGERVVAKSIQFLAASGDTALLTLQSATPGAAWKLVAQGGQAITGVRVSDCDASGGNLVVTCAPSAPVGENVKNWDFNASVAIWTGAQGDNKFATARNWSNEKSPDAETWAMIAPEAVSVSVTVSSAAHVKNLLVGGAGGTVTLTLQSPMTVDTAVDLQSGAKLVFSTYEALTVAGEFRVQNGAQVEHQFIGHLGDEFKYRVNVRAGSIVIDEGGLVNAKALGFYCRRGQGYSYCGGYAGAASTLDSYGSISSPTNCGSSGAGDNAQSGGVIRMVADGTLRVNGTITADGPYNRLDGGTASGGSIWLTCASLAGFGTITADGAPVDHAARYNPGGGGRIAICFTGDDPEADWTGRVSASGGGYIASCANAPGPAGTVYYQYGSDRRKSKVVIETDGQLSTATASHGKTQLSAATEADELGFVEIRDYANVHCTNTVADGVEQPLKYRDTEFLVYQRGKLQLTADLTIRDLDLREHTADATKKIANILLNGHKLYIRSAKHLNGRGWYADWETYVDKGETGDIIWLDAEKTVLSIR